MLQTPLTFNHNTEKQEITGTVGLNLLGNLPSAKNKMKEK